MSNELRGWGALGDCEKEPEGIGSPESGVGTAWELGAVDRSEMALVSSVDVPVFPWAA